MLGSGEYQSSRYVLRESRNPAGYMVARKVGEHTGDQEVVQEARTFRGEAKKRHESDQLRVRPDYQTLMAETLKNQNRWRESKRENHKRYMALIARNKSGGWVGKGVRMPVQATYSGPVYAADDPKQNKAAKMQLAKKPSPIGSGETSQRHSSMDQISHLAGILPGGASVRSEADVKKELEERKKKEQEKKEARLAAARKGGRGRGNQGPRITNFNMYYNAGHVPCAVDHRTSTKMV